MYVILVLDASGCIFNLIGPFETLAAAKAYDAKHKPSGVESEYRRLTTPSR